MPPTDEPPPLGGDTGPSRGSNACSRSFENCCVVTQSVRAAIPIDVQVLDSLGMVLKS